MKEEKKANCFTSYRGKEFFKRETGNFYSLEKKQVIEFLFDLGAGSFLR